jgi:hypothetical protein
MARVALLEAHVRTREPSGARRAAGTVVDDDGEALAGPCFLATNNSRRSVFSRA